MALPPITRASCSRRRCVNQQPGKASKVPLAQIYRSVRQSRKSEQWWHGCCTDGLRLRCAWSRRRAPRGQTGRRIVLAIVVVVRELNRVAAHPSFPTVRTRTDIDKCLSLFIILKYESGNDISYMVISFIRGPTEWFTLSMVCLVAIRQKRSTGTAEESKRLHATFYQYRIIL